MPKIRSSKTIKDTDITDLSKKFKQNVNVKVDRKLKTEFSPKIRNCLEDVCSVSKRYNKIPSGKNVYKVIFPYGGLYTKEFILNSLRDLIQPHNIVPIMYTINGKESYFFVDNEEEAKFIDTCNFKIITENKFKLRIIIRSSYPNLHDSDLTEAFKEKVCFALKKRFNAESNALDLTEFHRDADIAEEYFCGLWRHIVLNFILKIIEEYIPHLMALNLNKNKLTEIKPLRALNEKFPKLKILYIGDNNIADIRQLDNIKDVQLEEIVVENNPFCNLYEDKKIQFINEIRKRWPMLQRLNHQNLEKSISFDLDDDDIKAKLPSPRIIHSINEEIQKIEWDFLKFYFQIFDSDNRQNLIHVYHENAVVSMTVSFPQNVENVKHYYFSSRNILRITDPERRIRALKMGKISILSLMDTFPKTKHIEETFTLDTCFVTDKILMLVVTGLLQELNGDDQPLRYFSRTFVIIIDQNELKILNEQLYLSNPSHMQTKKFQIVSVTPALLSDEDMERMTLTFSQQSSMNLDWSKQCLLQYNFNYDAALAAFQDSLRSSRIPPEAFVK